MHVNEGIRVDDLIKHCGYQTILCIGVANSEPIGRCCITMLNLKYKILKISLM